MRGKAPWAATRLNNTRTSQMFDNQQAFKEKSDVCPIR